MTKNSCEEVLAKRSRVAKEKKRIDSREKIKGRKEIVGSKESTINIQELETNITDELKEVDEFVDIFVTPDLGAEFEVKQGSRQQLETLWWL